MAWDFSKLNFFSRLDARSRVVVLLVGVIGFIFLIYIGTKYFVGAPKTLGPSQVANAPGGLVSVPGTPAPSEEYANAVNIANQQRAQAARMTGTASVPTQVYTGTPTGGCVICAAQTPNVKTLLDGWSEKGEILPDVKDQLVALAAQNVTPDEYAAALDKLVKEGKLTPEQARLLLDEYRKQHAGALLNDSAKTMDGLIQSGQLPLEVANDLLNNQKNGMTPSQYAADLQRLVREGKITPEVAQQLLAQYAKQCLQEAAAKHIGLLQKMAGAGAITQDVVKQLADLTNRGVSLDDYSTALNSLVTGGKLTPDAQARLLNDYQQGKTSCGVSATLDALVRQAENAALQEISDLLAAKQITPEIAAQLNSMIQNNVSLDEYKAAVDQLVAQKKLTPQIGQLKIGDYQKVKQLRDMQQRLAALSANNATPSAYADELQRAVTAGIITPDQAKKLLDEYQQMLARPANITPVTGAGEFAALQQRVAAGGTAVPAPANVQFAAAPPPTAQVAPPEEVQNRIQALQAAMAGQAQNLISAWEPPHMEHKGGPDEGELGKKKEGGGEGGKEHGAGGAQEGGPIGPLLIKAGSILFAVLDTAVNSDYPDSPVLATIVDGPLKGAKLLGKLQTAKSVSGQLDRISLNFTIMNFDPWPKSKTITAYAIDPDTARTVLASDVNYHYMQRFGAIMATSFLQGYSSGITNAGTSTTGIFGTSTTHPTLSQGNKLLVGLGQVGQTLGSVVQNYVNIPPTVRVDSGVSLGILFMADVS